MLTIVSDATEFAVVTAIDSGCKFNAGYYMSEVPTPLSEWWRERGGEHFRKLIVHADTARPQKASVSQQFMAGNAMIIAARPPYSPDLTPFDFYLLGHVKGLLRESRLRLESNCQANFSCRFLLFHIMNCSKIDNGDYRNSHCRNTHVHDL
jgi:hypothetical protein